MADEVDELVLDLHGTSQHHEAGADFSLASTPSPASSSSSSYSPVSGGNDQDDHDRFEAWLHEADQSRSSLPSPSTYLPADQVVHDHTTRLEASKQLAEWLKRERTPAIELSKSVQQIELEIRNAIDSAAVRTSNDIRRHDAFVEDVRAAGGQPSDVLDYLQPVQAGQTRTTTDHPAEPELLLLMEVLIGDGRSETIEVHAGDQPEVLAAAFATKHGLGAAVIPQLTQHITEQVNALEDEDEETSSNIDDNLHEFPHDTSTPEPIQQTEAGGITLQVPVKSAVVMPIAHQPDDSQVFELQHSADRDHEREHSYNHLMEKYGHYTSHTNKVNPANAPKHGSDRVSVHSAQGDDGDPLTMRNLQLSEHARLMFTPRPAPFAASSKVHGSKDKGTVFNRLYSLAEAREKWIRRQQKAKASEEMKERQMQMKLEISAKSRDLVAGRTNGGFGNIGERLHEEALADIAKRERERERYQADKAQESDWTCPKCAHVNYHNDDVCKNIVASPAPLVSSPSSERSVTRRETYASTMWQSPPPEVVCGHARPRELFRPTLITVPTHVSRAVQMNKKRVNASTQSQRRARTQQQMEEEFKQTCPFRPKINELSEEIMRDKLEQEAKAAGNELAPSATGGIRRKNPHQSLYEDAFHAKAHREAKEHEYLSQFSFKPNIGVNALWGNRNNEDVIERLAVSKYQEMERRRQSLHDKYAPDRDPTTGRKFFTPETGRAPIFNRNERGLPIGDFLYEAHKEHEEYHRLLKQQAADEIKQQSGQRFLSDQSQRVLEARKKKTFARLFDYLLKQSNPPASDGDPTSKEERVHPQVVDLSQVPQDVARVVSIVFEFANHEPMTFTAFEGYMQKLMVEVPGFTYTQVLFLTENLNDGKSARPGVPDKRGEDEPLKDPELTFHPAIDKNSDELAKKHGRAERANVYEALNQYYNHYKERKDQIKKHHEREFARTHPFQPVFVSKDRHAKAEAFYDKLGNSKRASTQQHVPNRSKADQTTTLKTAVPNARPFVRPIDRGHPSTDHLRSRSTSLASSKHSDDDDAVLTSRVLAALDDQPQGSTVSSLGGVASTAHPVVATSLFTSKGPIAASPHG